MSEHHLTADRGRPCAEPGHARQTGMAEPRVGDGGTDQPEAGRFDRMAIGLSVLCLVHCLALPVALLAFPAVGLLVTHAETTVHWALLLAAIPMSGYALWRGFQRHARWDSVLLGGVGLLIMLVSVILPTTSQGETAGTVLGVSLVLAAHLRNLGHQLRRANAQACTADHAECSRGC